MRLGSATILLSTASGGRGSQLFPAGHTEPFKMSSSELSIGAFLSVNILSAVEGWLRVHRLWNTRIVAATA